MGELFRRLRSWLEWRQVLSELRMREIQESRDLAHIFTEEMNQAKTAFDYGDQARALAIWRTTRVRFPYLAVTTDIAINLVLDLGRYDEAEEMLREGRRRCPSAVSFYATGAARVAYRRGDLEEAVRRCKVLRRRCPEALEGYTIASTCFADLGRHKNAEAMITHAVRRFPLESEVLIEHARCAVRLGDWQEAFRRWKLVSTRFDNAIGGFGAAQCLKEMGRFTDAERLATETWRRFPTNPWSFATLADIAMARGDLEAAATHWRVARSQTPFFARAYTAGVDVARRRGLEADADEILCLAVSRLRSDIELHLDYARSAHRRGDLSAATERWKLVRERFPECEEARSFDKVSA